MAEASGGRQKADYGAISHVYDAARGWDRPHVQWWLCRLAEAGRLGPGKLLLDVGCGTGRWCIPLVERSGCQAVGVDSSPQMLEQARGRDRTGRIRWLVGDACDAPVPPASSGPSWTGRLPGLD